MSKKQNKTPEEILEETSAEETEVTPEEAETPAEPAEKSEAEKLTEELATQKNNYLRLAAEYDNYRKRTQQEKLSLYADATAKAVEKLLPLLDSINAALAAPAESENERQGIELIANQLKKCLEDLGVEGFGEIGDTFDPMIHNAISRTDSDELPQNSIAMVFQKGFKIGDKVIRPAMVQVANC